MVTVTITHTLAFIMRYIIAFSILTILLGCSSKLEQEETVDSDDLICSYETTIAIELLKNDTLQFILINEFPRYERELNQLLIKSNIQLHLIGSMHGEGYCQKVVMDSVINERYGSEFRIKIENEADSLFLESNRDSIFSGQHLDKRPTLSSNSGANGQDEIIKILNQKHLLNDSLELISNVVEAPYFVVRFTVSKDGTSSNAKITERNSTSNYTYLEGIILNEINGLTNWSAGQIRNESVSSAIDVAIAVKKK